MHMQRRIHITSDCAMIMNCDADELNDCDANADCIDHEGPGQHSCTCTEGYSGDGTVNKCDDTDDCANRPCFASADGLYSSTCLDEAAPNTGFTCDACPDSLGWRRRCNC